MYCWFPRNFLLLYRSIFLFFTPDFGGFAHSRKILLKFFPLFSARIFPLSCFSREINAQSADQNVYIETSPISGPLSLTAAEINFILSFNLLPALTASDTTSSSTPTTTMRASFLAALCSCSAASARLLHSLPEDTYAFPKYRVSFLNGLPLLNKTAQRWLTEGLRGGEQEFLDQPWKDADWETLSHLKEIGSGAQEESVRTFATLQRFLNSKKASNSLLLYPLITLSST